MVGIAGKNMLADSGLRNSKDEVRQQSLRESTKYAFSRT